MTTEERLAQLEKKFEDLELARSVVFTESIKGRVLQDVVQSGVLDTTLTALNGTTSVPAGGGSVLHAKQYNKRLLVYIDKIPYYIGLYNI